MRIEKRKTSTVVFVAFCWVAVTVFPARAQANRAEAEKLFRAGEHAYNTGQYIVAAQAFEEAYRLMPVPAIAFSTAQAYRLQYFVDKDPGRLKRSIELYRTYIEQVAKGGRRDDAAASLAELEPILLRIEAEKQGPIEIRTVMQSTTQLMVTTQVVGARAAIDDKEGEVPLIREVTPGSHEVRVTAEGYFPVEQRATAVAGKLIPLEITLKPMPAKLELRTEGGARVALDGRPVGRAPFARPVEMIAGRHFVSVTRRGRRTWNREISVQRGELLELEAPLRKTTQRKLSYWVLGGSGALLLASGVAGFMAMGAQSDAEELNDQRLSEGLTPAQLEDYDQARDRRDDRMRTTYWLLGIGTAVGVTGVLMLLFDNPGAEAPPPAAALEPAPSETEKKATPITVAPYIGRDVAGLAVGGQF
ncbi:MAG: PEGA domain-containing protein [Deltaproteobacteria bacterium]|nr:PEGA domain-containing protein [Deltaproteobacteria bacterium]